MKKGKKISILLSLILVVTLTIILLPKGNKTMKVNDSRNILHNKNIALMIEQDNGMYDESTSNSWPNTEYYIFNPNLSKCDKGGRLSYDEGKNIINVKSTKTEKCYLYFDVYDFTKSCNYGYEDNIGCDLIKKNDKTLIYHDGKCDNDEESNCNLEAEDNNYRYSGSSSEVNNFICFGSDASSCPIDNLYRIIGIFEGNVKLIKFDYANSNLLGNDGAYSTDVFSNWSTYQGSNSSINRYDWNNETSTSLWKESNLNLINLNTNYYGKFSKDWQDKIENKIYYVGGASYYYLIETNARIAYDHEIGKDSLKVDSDACANTINGIHKCTKDDVIYNKYPIALMYISDYYFAAGSSGWNVVGFSRADEIDYRTIRENNWMYMGLQDWTLTRINANNANRVVMINNSGYTDNYDFGVNFNYKFAIRPVFYLKKNVKLISGTGNGTKTSPYRVI